MACRLSHRPTAAGYWGRETRWKGTMSGKLDGDNYQFTTIEAGPAPPSPGERVLCEWRVSMASLVSLGEQRSTDASPEVIADPTVRELRQPREVGICPRLRPVRTGHRLPSLFHSPLLPDGNTVPEGDDAE
jgi:hypothetical protein